MTILEFMGMFNRLPHAVRVELATAIDDGRTLEVQRILTRVTGDGRLASEAVAAIVRYWRTGR